MLLLVDGLNTNTQRHLSAGAICSPAIGDPHWITSSLAQPPSAPFSSPDGSESLFILLAVCTGTLHVIGGGQLVLVLHALAAVTVAVTNVHLHRGLRVWTWTGWLWGQTMTHFQLHETDLS